jgi:GxxExxY protein
MHWRLNLKKIVYLTNGKTDIVTYKDKILPHKYYADFIVYDNITLEVKACKNILEEFLAQTLNYMSLAKSKVGLIVNFGEKSLTHKRLAL